MLQTFVTMPDVIKYLLSDVKLTPQPANKNWRRPLGTRSCTRDAILVPDETSWM